MPVRALLNLVYATWTDGMTSGGRDQLDFVLMPLAEQEQVQRRDRVASALDIPGVVIT